MTHRDPGTGLRIRAMAEGDLDRVVSIAFALPTAPHWMRPAYEAAIFSRDAHWDWSRRIALTAEHSNEVIGFAIVRVVARVAEIETIAIATHAQGMGFGSTLLQAVVEESRLAGATEAELEVRASNGWAIRLYERAGFVEVGRRRGYYQETIEDGLLMRLEISGIPSGN